MAVKDIATVFTITTHQVIGSRYEAQLYAGQKQMLEDFERDIELQIDNTYKDKIELFNVVVSLDDGETATKIFTNDGETPITKEGVIEFVEQFFES